MKKIKLFSATLPIPLNIEGEEVTDLSINFYFVLNKTYVFTFLIDSPNLSCSDRNPIKLWKRFLITKEAELIKYTRRWENTLYRQKVRARNESTKEPNREDARLLG